MSERPSLTGLLEAIKFYKSEYCIGSLVALDCVRIDREALQIKEEVIAVLKKEKSGNYPSLRTVEKLRDFLHNVLAFCSPEVKEIRQGDTKEFVFVDRNRERISYGSIIVKYVLFLPEKEREDKNLLNMGENKYLLLQAINESGIRSSQLEDKIDAALGIYDPDAPTFKESMLYGVGDIGGSSIYGRAVRYQTTKQLEVERKTALFYILSFTNQDDEPEERISKALTDIDQTKASFHEFKESTNSIERFLLLTEVQEKLFGINSEEYPGPDPVRDAGKYQKIRDQIDYIRASILKNRKWLQRYLSN